MASSEVCTPRKIPVRTSSCVLCGFSFIQIEISSTGERVEKKLFKLKLQLNSERIAIISTVVTGFEVNAGVDKDNGVCIKCFRKVQQSIKLKKNALKMQEELSASRVKVQQTILNLPSPRKFQIEKRMLRSPASTQISKQMKTFPTCTIATPLCSIPSLTKATHVTSGKLHLVTVPVQISLTKSQTQQSVPVAAMPLPSERQLPSIAPAPEISQQYTVQSSDRHDMDTTQELRLKEVAYNNNLSNSLYQMQQSGCLCDVTLNTLTDKIPIHKIVLVTMMTPLCTRKGGMDKFVYKFKALCRNYEGNVVLPLVRYIYTGEIRVKMELVEDFINMCKILELDTLVSGLQKLIPQYCQRIEHVELQVSDSDNAMAHELTYDTEADQKSSSDITVHTEAVESENGSGPCMYITNSSSEQNANINSEIKQEFIETENAESNVSLEIKQEFIETELAESNVSLEIKQEFIETENDASSTIETAHLDNSLPADIKIEYVGDDCETDKGQVLDWPGQSGLNEENNLQEQSTLCRSLLLEPSDVKLSNVGQEENYVVQNLDVNVNQSSVTEENDNSGLKKCNICNKYFKKDQFMQHTNKEHNLHACSVCHWTGQHPQELLNHVLAQHNTPPPGKKSLRQNKCGHEGCPFRTSFMKQLKEHQSTHEKAYAVCDVCGKNFESRSGYRQHVLSHKKDDFTFCEKCHEVIRDKTKGHKCVKKKKNIVKQQRLGVVKFCTKCPYRSNCIDTLHRHMRSKHGGLPPFANLHNSIQMAVQAITSQAKDQKKGERIDSPIQTQHEHSEEKMDTTIKSEPIQEVQDFLLHKMSSSLEDMSSVHTGKVMTGGLEENTHLSSTLATTTFKEEEVTHTESSTEDTYMSSIPLVNTTSGHGVVIEENSRMISLLGTNSGHVDVKGVDTRVSSLLGTTLSHGDVITEDMHVSSLLGTTSDHGDVIMGDPTHMQSSEEVAMMSTTN